MKSGKPIAEIKPVVSTSKRLRPYEDTGEFIELYNSGDEPVVRSDSNNPVEPALNEAKGWALPTLRLGILGGGCW